MPAEGCVQERESIVVVAAGAGPTRLDDLPDGAVVIAADGGLERCRELGLRASVVVGDFDSVGAEALAAAERDGAELLRHPTRKDASDLELALDEALARGAGRIVVVASAEGRLDHLLASLLLLASDRYEGVEIDALVGEARVHVVRRQRMLEGAPGELVTLLALGGPAVGVTTDGLEYPLNDETLEPGSSRGVSNTFVDHRATISVDRGALLAILPAGEP
jgi:thiamine pyrophosphokinase